MSLNWEMHLGYQPGKSVDFAFTEGGKKSMRLRSHWLYRSGNDFKPGIQCRKFETALIKDSGVVEDGFENGN